MRLTRTDVHKQEKKKKKSYYCTQHVTQLIDFAHNVFMYRSNALDIMNGLTAEINTTYE